MSGSVARQSVGASTVSDGGSKLVPQPHGGALSRGGRKPGSRNRPKPVLQRVKAAAGRKCMGALKVIADIMQDERATARTRLAAAQVMLSYGVGRPVPMEFAEDEQGREARLQRIDQFFAIAAAPEAERELERLRARIEELEGAAA